MGERRALSHPDPVYIPGSGYAPSGGGGGGGGAAAGGSPASNPGAQPIPVIGESKFKPPEQRMPGSNGRGEECWTRPPVSTGKGASHVKSFHCKLTGESLEFMDRQINEWLDAHPDFEVKFCSSSVGEWMGKSMKEHNLIVQVWV